MAKRITGRITQLIALGISLAIAAVVGKWSLVSDALVTVINGFVIFTSAVGIDQVVNYGRAGKSKPAPTPVNAPNSVPMAGKWTTDY